MNTWHDVIQHHILAHVNEVQKTTRALQDLFGVNYFTYHSIDREGRYLVLLDRPDWSEFYVSEKLFLHDPYLQAYSAYESGFCLVEMNGSAEYKKEILQAGSRFEMDLVHND